eukprot:923656-Pyramimonas_sp.AAC.1
MVVIALGTWLGACDNEEARQDICAWSRQWVEANARVSATHFDVTALRAAMQFGFDMSRGGPSETQGTYSDRFESL